MARGAQRQFKDCRGHEGRWLASTRIYGDSGCAGLEVRASHDQLPPFPGRRTLPHANFVAQKYACQPRLFASESNAEHAEAQLSRACGRPK